MKLIDTQAMQAIEQQTINEYKISSLILMENAGLNIFAAIRNILGEFENCNTVL